jgi:multidrug efflux pump subunit AcrA (membrane-fusion protein)
MKHKTVRTAVAITVAAVAAVGVALFFLTRGEPTKTVTVVPVSNVYTSYWGDSKTLDGYVTTGSLQELYMTEGGFEKIVVKEGDRVRKGDVLVEYNNTQSELMLRGDLAKVNLLKSQITAFEQKVSKHYQEINRLEKVLEGEPTTPPTAPMKAPTASHLHNVTAYSRIRLNRYRIRSFHCSTRISSFADFLL